MAMTITIPPSTPRDVCDHVAKLLLVEPTIASASSVGTFAGYLSILRPSGMTTTSADSMRDLLGA